MNKKYFIILYVIVSCILMALVEFVIEPVYFIKSLIKVFMFFVFPIILFKYFKMDLFNNFKLNKKDIFKLFGMGVGIYIIGLIMYFILKDYFDFSKIVSTMMSDQSVSKNNFIYVALYISFGNSLLEEFFFRLISFIKLGEYLSKKFSYIFSALMFSLYHIGMIATSFPFLLTILSIIVLFTLGIILNYLNDKNKNIFNSWFVHMFCDFLVMTVGFINIM